MRILVLTMFAAMCCSAFAQKFVGEDDPAKVRALRSDACYLAALDKLPKLPNATSQLKFVDFIEIEQRWSGMKKSIHVDYFFVQVAYSAAGKSVEYISVCEVSDQPMSINIVDGPAPAIINKSSAADPEAELMKRFKKP